MDEELAPFVNALKYPFMEWKRLGYLFLWFIPIIGWFAFGGYLIRQLGGLVKGKTQKTGAPEFGNFMENLEWGFFAFIIALIYQVPIQLPWQILTFALEKTAPGLILVFFPFMILASIIVSAFLVIALIKYAETKDFKKAFTLSANWNLIKKYWGDLIVYWFMYILLSIVFMIPGFIAFGLAMGGVITAFLFSKLLFPIGMLWAAFFGIIAFGFMTASSYGKNYLLAHMYRGWKK